MLLLTKKLEVYLIQSTFKRNNQKVYSCRLMCWDQNEYTFILDNENPILFEIENSSVHVVTDSTNVIREQKDRLYGF